MFNVADVIARTQFITLDTAAVRWTEEELLAWINDAQLEIVSLKPTAHTVFTEIPLVEGVYQELPENGVALLSIVFNVEGNACTLVTREDLEASLPQWATMPAETEAAHYLVDEDDPRHFFVCPPNDGDGAVFGRYSVLPPVIESVNGQCVLSLMYMPIMTRYVLFRLYSKHSSSPENQRLAQQELQGFFQSLGVKIQSLFTYSPMRDHEKAVNGPSSV